MTELTQDAHQRQMKGILGRAQDTGFACSLSESHRRTLQEYCIRVNHD